MELQRDMEVLLLLPREGKARRPMVRTTLVPTFPGYLHSEWVYKARKYPHSFLSLVQEQAPLTIGSQQELCSKPLLPAQLLNPLQSLY